jgi:methylglutaconyl-CoA hydratase
MASDVLKVQQEGPVLRLTMARPERRNALSRNLVGALRAAIAGVEEGGPTRVVVLAGEGPVFCAGGDITEYREMAERGPRREDAEGLADLLAAMAACPAPVVARVQGAAFGGGFGLVCAADIAVAAAGTRFSLSEARLGLVPAVISPYVLAALGRRQATARMLLAAPFGVEEALRCGLIHQAAPADGLDGAMEEVVRDLLRGAPGALTTIKRIPEMVAAADPGHLRDLTAGLLTDRLASDEGREGLTAFLEKRRPAWAPREDESA